jgi:acetyl esterase
MRQLTRYFIILLSLTPFCSPAFADHSIKHHVGIVWASPKGFNLTLDIAIPQTSDTKPKPVLVIFHGGGFLLNGKSIMTDLANTIASRTDVITVNANYRLLSDLDNTTTINEIIEDGMGAVLWVKDNIKQYGGDPTKVAVTGDSAGGHLAAMVTLAGRNLDSDGFAKKPLGFKPTYLPKDMTAEQVARKDGLKVQATILSYAGFSLVGMAENGFEKDGPFWKWAHAKARGFFGDKINIKDNPEYYLALSPDQYLVNAKDYKLPPQFVHVGELDQMTKPEFSQKYVDQLKSLGQSARLKIYPGKSHGFLDSGCNDYNHGCFDDMSKPTVDDMVAFLNEVFHL